MKPLILRKRLVSTGDDMQIKTPRLPLLSIVVPNLNGGQYLTHALESILAQDGPPYELIVVDGGSTDCSPDVLQRFRNRIDKLIVEPDCGQADAIMKGVAAARGEIFNWINSDDSLLPGALATVSKGIEGADCFAGAVQEIDEFGHPVRTVFQRRISSASILRHPWRGSSYHQPGVWLRRSRFLNCGGLNRSLHFAFDRDMMIRYLENCSGVVIRDRPIAVFRLHSKSKTVAQPKRFIEEQSASLNYFAHNGTPRLQRIAQSQLRRLVWWSELESIGQIAMEGQRLKAALLLLRGVAKRPPERIGRASFGTMMRIISSW